MLAGACSPCLAIVGPLCATLPAQGTTLVSRSTSGTQGNSYSFGASISADGRYVTFESNATNLVPTDANGQLNDIFVRTLQTGATALVSQSGSGEQGNSLSESPSISADGRYVAFFSAATNLVTPDANGNFDDVFVRDLLAGTTILVSQSTSGVQGNHHSQYPSISADGRYVAFKSYATNLAGSDANGLVSDIFVRDLQTGTTTLVSQSSLGIQANNQSLWISVSADGRYVAFYSDASNLVITDTNNAGDVFVRDLQTNTTTLVSVSTSGAQGNAYSELPSISGDGRYVAFSGSATNFVTPDANGANEDVFLRDLQTGTTTLVSMSTSGVQGNANSAVPSISPDGRYVAFFGEATNLAGPDANGNLLDAFVRDLQTGTTTLVSQSSLGVQGNDDSGAPSISADGRYIAFTSKATNLVAPDANGSVWDVFLRDRGPTGLLAHCFGDGSGSPCPCGNSGGPGRGCDNSTATGGAVLTATGDPSLSSDTLVLTSSGELPSALSIFLQGTQAIAPVLYGDGLRCAGGTLKRLYVKSASGGVVTAPQAGDPSVSSRSAALGDPIPQGATRHYQTYYRDPAPGFCPDPPGKTWNVSSALSISWSQ